MSNRELKGKLKIVMIIAILICLNFTMTLFPDLLFRSSLGSSIWNQTTENDFENGTIDNLSILGKGSNARLEINLSGIQTWTRMKPINKPIARYGHSMAPIWGTDKVLLFGGFSIPGGNVVRDDTWLYDFSNNTWTQRSPMNKPSARHSHAMASVRGDDKVILFGGTIQVMDSKDDIWVYDLSEDNWTELTKGPRGRYGHAMATIDGDDKVLIAGGIYFDGMTYSYYNDTWVYDLSEDKWIRKSDMPEGRWQLAMAAIEGSDKFIVYGGVPLFWNNDTWIYDLSEDKWTVKKLEPNPSYRYYHAMSRIPGTDNVLLFGGHGVERNNDTWVYDLSDDRWTKKKTEEQPVSRDGLAISFIYGVDRAVMFGGYFYDNFPTWINYDDTWIYRHELPTKNGTFISSAYDCGHNSSFYELSWYATTPAPDVSSVRLQIRTADSATNLISKAFLGPDGTENSYYTTSPTSIWFGHDGDRWVQFQIYLNLSKFTDSPAIKDISITYNCYPDIKAMGPNDGCIKTYNKPQFTWEFDDLDSTHQKAYQLVISNDISFQYVVFDSMEQVTTNEQWSFPEGTNYTELSDGVWYWSVRAKDEDDFWTMFTKPRRLIIDTCPPSSAVVFPSQDRYYNEITSINGIATDGINCTGTSKVELMIKNNNFDRYWSGSNWVNVTTWVTAEVSEDIEGSLGEKQWSYDATNITWTSGYRYFIQSRARDVAGNVEIPNSGNNFRTDMDSPISMISAPKSEVYLNDLDLISGTSFDISGSGLNKVEVCIKCLSDTNIWDGGNNTNKFWDGSRWSTIIDWLLASGTNNWSLNTDSIPWATGNQYLIQTRAFDNSGNIESPVIGCMFYYDEDLPIKLSITINDDDKYTNTPEAILTLHAEDIGFGVSEMAFSTDGSEWSGWTAFNKTLTFDLPTGDGEKVIYFKVRDLAGNSAEQVYDKIILDTSPPVELNIVINEDAKYTKSISVGLTLTATDILSGPAEMAFSFDSIYWLPWEKFARTKSIIIPKGDGIKNVYFKVMDGVNNTALPVYDSIILDSTPPHLLTISINNGAAQTNNTNIKLKLGSYDDTSGVNQMSFSFDGEHWTAWEIFNPDCSLILPMGDGRKTVYFRTNDLAGNVANPSSASILLNTTVPSENEKVTKESIADSSFILYLSLIIIIALILTLVLLIFVIKRRKKYVQELLPPGFIKVRSGGLLLPSFKPDELTAILEQVKTPTSGATLGASVTVPAIAPTSQIPALPAQSLSSSSAPHTKVNPNNKSNNE